MTRVGVLHPYRSDPGVIGFIEEHLEIDAELDIRGSQDGMSDEEIRAHSEGVEPNSHAEILGDGSTVYITRDVVLDGMIRQTKSVLADGCDAVIVCCTLPWPELDAMSGVVTPCAVLERSAVTLAPEGGTIGVIQPVEAAMDQEIEHWQALGAAHSLGIVSVCAAPELPGEEVLAGDEDYISAARELVEQGADVIVMDCMAFTEAHRRLVSGASGAVPVLRAMQLTADLVAHAYR